MRSLAKRLLVAWVVVVATIGGCVYLPLDGGTSALISFRGDIRATDGTFVMKGTLENGGVTEATAEEVSIYLYHENGTLLDRIRLGNFDGSIPVSVRSQEVPHYVIISAPEFWVEDNIEVDYFELTEEGYYEGHIISEQSELPVQPN